MLLWQHDQCFFYFSEKRHKIVEIFALLTTELSSYTRSYYRKESAAVTHKLNAKFLDPIKEHY